MTEMAKLSKPLKNDLGHCIRKTNNMHMRKQRRRPALRLPRSWSAPLFSLLRYYNPSSSFIRNFKILAIFCDCTGWFVLDLVGNPNCWFSHAQDHFTSHLYRLGGAALLCCISLITTSRQVLRNLTLWVDDPPGSSASNIREHW